MSYQNSDGTLKDEIIAKDIRKAADMFENGEILEAQCLLTDVSNALLSFILYQ